MARRVPKVNLGLVGARRDGLPTRSRPPPRVPGAVRSHPSCTRPPVVPRPCAPRAPGPDAAPPSSPLRDERGSTPSARRHRQRAPARRSVASAHRRRSRCTDCTPPNVTPAASRSVRQSARSRCAKTASSTCTSALACCLRAALVAKRGSSARSARPIAARNPCHCRGSLM